MDVAAGADALDDLLAEVAAFGEVQGAGLVGLLGEVAVADIDADRAELPSRMRRYSRLWVRRGWRRLVQARSRGWRWWLSSAQSSKRGTRGLYA